MHPGFLFALASLAIPVVVHLFNFRKYQKVYFSNVQFLKEVQEQQSSRRNLRERLILLSRLLALLFLVLAFAKPFIPHTPGATAVARNEAVSVFVDNSNSMQSLSREGSLLDEAKRRAKEIASAYGLNTHFQLLTQDFEGRHQRLLTRDEFNAAVDTVKLSNQSRTLQQIVNRQNSLLQSQKDSAAPLYLISDFQQSTLGSRPVKTGSAQRINMVQLTANKLPNVTVDSVWLLSAVHRPNETEKLVVKLHNYAAEEAKGVPLKLLINGRPRALGSFSISPRATRQDTLSFSGLQAGWQQAELQLQDNPVIFDNTFYFTFKVSNQLPVLLISGGSPNPYLQAVFGSDRFFAATTITDGNVNYAGLNNYPLIVLSDVKSISPGLAQQLKAYVNRGGSLSVFMAPGADVASYRPLLQGLNAAYPANLVTAPTKVSSLNVQSPLFKNVFEEMPRNPDLPTVKQYYSLVLPARSLSYNLMELPGHEPFWAASRSGAGNVYVCAVPLIDEYSNLPRHALLLPAMFGMALNGGNAQPLFYTIGKDVGIEIPPLPISEKQLLKLSLGRRSFIPDVRQQQGGTLLYVADQVQQPGNYQLKRQDSLVAAVAFNSNRAESDLTYMDAEMIARIAPGRAKVWQPQGASLAGQVADTNLGLQLWKLCIILVLIFVAAEVLLVRLFKPDRQQVSGSV